jgi:hypothetical protein
MRLISWSISSVTFPKLEGGERKDRRLIPVPRRTLRLLAGCKRPVVAATVLGHLIRCVFFRSGECFSRGTCKASWLADTFGVNVRSVKAARKQLAEVGWLEVAESDHWHKQQWGGTAVVNLCWGGPARKRKGAFSPRQEFSTSKFSPPDSNKKLSSRVRYQKLVSEPSGVKTGEPGKPSIGNIKLEDLLRFSRTEELYRQAVSVGLVKHSENQVLNWIGAAVRAKAVAGDPVRVFAGIVRKKLWRYITQEQEDQARRALTRYRDVNPALFRFEAGSPSRSAFNGY